jgi:hypothetical protein
MTTRLRGDDIPAESLHDGGSLRLLPENPADCHPVRPIPPAAALSDRSGGGCRARQAGPWRRACARTGHADSGFRLRGREAISVWAAARPGRKGGARLLPVTGRPAGSPGRLAGHLLAGEQPLCRRTSPVPAGRAGMQGGAASLPRYRVGRGPAGALPPVTVAIPGSPRPGVPPGRIGAGPFRGRVLRGYLPYTSQGPGRGTTGQRRI